MAKPWIPHPLASCAISFAGSQMILNGGEITLVWAGGVAMLATFTIYLSYLVWWMIRHG